MPFRYAPTQRDQPLFFEPLKYGPIFRELESALAWSLEMRAPVRASQVPRLIFRYGSRFRFLRLQPTDFAASC